MSIMSCKDLYVSYGGFTAVHGVNLALEQGDYLCIVGENGSGKSSLMNCMLGIAQPSMGSIKYNGINPVEIGYLPQQTALQKDFPANVDEVVLSGCLNRHGVFAFYSKDDRERALRNMKYLKIDGLKTKSYRDLSGGQQQRVLLARALCAAEKLLMLDEPVTGLDPMMTNDMYDLLEKMNRDQGMTIVMISHDIASAVKYSNKILHLKKSPIFSGLTKDYIQTDMYRNITRGGEHA